MPNFTREAKEYDLTYHSIWEDEAHAQRGEFLRRFPLGRISSITLKDYAIGQNGRETFCYWVEPGTRKWATIVGASSGKFGVYYGKTKKDLAKRFRYTKKFSRGLPDQGAERLVFRNIHNALIDLIQDGKSLNFEAIDANPLSQMLKAKTLSLYFPDKYLPICSDDNLIDLASALNLDGSYLSQIQHDALAAQSKSPGVRKWTTLKYAAFLYQHILGHGLPFQNTGQSSKRPPKSTQKRKVDFDKLMKLWKERGNKSEAFALEQEKARLISLGYPKLARRIKDRTKRPGYGYDFESFSSPNQPRYIEVKTFTPVDNEVSRFFLSENERATACRREMKDRYYFYLVIYGPDGNPIDCQIRSAQHVLEDGDLQAQNYLVRLARHQFD